jgi:hypothetical protein
VTPETPESRLARLEERQASTNRIVETFGPTGRQVVEATADIKAMREAWASFQVERERERREFRDWVVEIKRALEGEVLACAQANGQLRELWEAEREDRDEERRADKKDRKTFMRNLTLAFVAGMFTVIGVVVAALLQNGGL